MENKEPTSSELIKSEMVKLKKNVKLILFIGAPLLILMPILTTQLNVLFDFTTTETSAIGDTIGGITAPVIGVISALLIYYSFRAQINSNIIIQNQIDQQRKEDTEKKEFNYQMEVYKHLKESIENFQYRVLGKELLTGSSAFHEYWNVVISGLSSIQKGPSKSFENILNLFEVILDELKIYEDKKTDIKLVLFLTELQFNQYIWESYYNGILVGTVEPGKSNSLRAKVVIIERIQSKIEALKSHKKVD